LRLHFAIVSHNIQTHVLTLAQLPSAAAAAAAAAAAVSRGPDTHL